jgi:2-polyprenyl-3-methyl-5-hydroxy-6-metoxy-1,4-benzoquinol methylase
MQQPNTSIIDQPWPDDELEYVDACPYCGSKDRTLAYKNVQDWSFYCASGNWTYWDCKGCEALYLSPRPSEASIGKAYSSYYTHSSEKKESILQLLKERIKNECWSHWLNADIKPRLYIPKVLGCLLTPMKSRLIELFGLRELLTRPKGKLMDIGCGNGYTLSLATRLGWHTTGLEIDPIALHVAHTQGLNVLEGTYEKLDEYRQVFDCIVCSHVLEHVHKPQDMLIKLKDALKPGGILLLSLPNASSMLRFHFGENWRGLEAPRHLSIPSMYQLKASLVEMGFSVSQRQLNSYSTAVESSRIQRRATKISAYDRKVKKMLIADKGHPVDSLDDFIQFICLKN